jgi:hypothetical protein
VTKCISRKENVTFEVKVNTPKLFEKQTVKIIPNSFSHSQMWVKEEIKQINAES